MVLQYFKGSEVVKVIAEAIYGSSKPNHLLVLTDKGALVISVDDLLCCRSPKHEKELAALSKAKEANV
jgi:hypothetical protein